MLHFNITALSDLAEKAIIHVALNYNPI